MAWTHRCARFGPEALFKIAACCTALRAWDVRSCRLTLRQMDRLMKTVPDVAMMSSGKPLFVLGERSFVLFEGDEVSPRSMSFRLRMEALVRHPRYSGHLSLVKNVVDEHHLADQVLDTLACMLVA